MTASQVDAQVQHQSVIAKSTKGFSHAASNPKSHMQGGWEEKERHYLVPKGSEGRSCQQLVPKGTEAVTVNCLPQRGQRQ